MFTEKFFNNNMKTIAIELGLDRNEANNIQSCCRGNLLELNFNTDYLCYDIYMDAISNEIVGINSFPVGR